MTKRKKIWLGIFTFLPVLFIIIYIASFFLYFFSFVEVIDHGANTGHDPNPAWLLGSFAIMFIMILLAVLSCIGLLIYYVIHANSNPNLDSNQKLIWILVLVLASGIGNVIYYIVEILPKDKNNATLQ